MARQDPLVYAPRVILQGERYRLVEDERPDANGVLEKVHTLEFLDGTDAMGDPRWIDAYKRDAHAVFLGAVGWLKREYCQRFADKEQE